MSTGDDSPDVSSSDEIGKGERTGETKGSCFILNTDSEGSEDFRFSRWVFDGIVSDGIGGVIGDNAED